jgi:hypothetical protein
MSKARNLDPRQIKRLLQDEEKRLREARERAHAIAQAGGAVVRGKWVPAILRKKS